MEQLLDDNIYEVLKDCEEVVLQELDAVDNLRSIERPDDLSEMQTLVESFVEPRSLLQESLS